MENNIKWSVILAAQSDPEMFIRCMAKLVKSIDPSRTEIILVCAVGDQFVQNIFKYYTRQTNLEVPVTYIQFSTKTDSLVHMWNIGAEIAQGERLIFLSDRTVVTDNFIVKLAHGFDTYLRDYKTGPAGIAAPLISKALGNMNITLDNLDQVQANIDKQAQNAKQWSMSLGVGKACLFVSKDVFGELGGFRVGLDYGFTAIDDFVVRILERGLLPVIAADTLVYHDLLEEKDNPLVLYKAYKKLDQKLAVAYRVKVNSQYTLETFIESLKRSSEFADGIFILDDNSKVRVASYIKENHLDLWSNVTFSIKYSRSFDEKRDFNELYDRARKAGYSWILFLDADDVLEDRFDLAYKTKLINPINPFILGYVLHNYYLWGDNDHWRIDKQWGQGNDIRLMRILPDREITLPGKISSQFGFGPTLPSECIRDSGIRVKNYGFKILEEREYRRDFYEHLDVKINSLPPEGWNYLVNENRMTRYPWVNSSLSVYSPVRIGGELLFEWLDACGYFADEIVVGDNGISDDDKELVLMYKAKIVPTEMSFDFSVPRNECLRACTQSHILQLDLDERVDNWSALRRMLDTPNVDCWQIPISNFQKNGEVITSETTRLFKNDGKVEYWGYLHETIDDYVQTHGWRLGKTPLRINHYGYLKSTPQELWSKMQRYLEINLKQMQDFPMDGRSYYNTAIHLLEDNCQDDALRLLQISIHLVSRFPLSSMEMGKTYLLKAYFWFNRATKLFGNHPNAPYLEKLKNTLKPILPKNFPMAPGHCLSYFQKNPEKIEWLRKHIESMEKKIENMRLKQMEGKG